MRDVHKEISYYGFSQIRKYVPTVTMIADRRRRGVTFSFKKTADMIEAHTGEEELNGVALEAPINFRLKRNVIPAITIPVAPEAERSTRSFLVIFHFLIGFEIKRRKRKRIA